MAASRSNKLALAVGLLTVAAVVFSSMPVNSLKEGVGSQEVGTGNARGCTCHSPTPSNTATISFQVSGLANGYYQAGKTYSVTISYTDDSVPPNATTTTNHGGFNVAASAGTFALNSNSSYNGTAFVQLKDNGVEITHTEQGDVMGTADANGSHYRMWSFDWKSPTSNASDVTFDILVNAVNGDGTQSSLDHWSRTYVVLPGQPGASTGEVDIAKLGVPLRAYWLGVIGILSTMVLLVFSFYVIRSGSKFYEYGLPRGQVKTMKIQTIPPPKNKGAYVVMAGLGLIDLAILLTFLGVRDEQLDAFKTSMFVLGFFGVLALGFVYYIRAFLPIVNVMEEESIEPLK